MDNTSSSTCLSHEWAATCFNSFTSNRANRIARNAVTSMDVMAAARDISVMPTYHDTFGIKLKHTGDITNQKHSGRCWMFTAFNVLRHETIKFLDVDNFEFSQAYGMFYDKLEKAHASLEYAIQTADKPLDDRNVMWQLDMVAQDGGYYCYAMSMIQKWGMVPKDIMPETACSENSEAMDDQLARLLHKHMLALRTSFAKGASAQELAAQKEAAMKEVYQLLAICLGNPPQTFDFTIEVGKKCKAAKELISVIEPQDKDDEKDEKDEKDEGKKASRSKDNEQADKNEKDEKDERRLLRDCGLTPLSFMHKYVPICPTNYVQLVSIPHSQFEYNKVYHVRYNESVLGGCMPARYMNVPQHVLEQCAIASLKADAPVSMACDVCQEFPRYIDDFKYVLGLDSVDLSGLFGIDMSMTRSEMLDAQETHLTHAMTFQGVQLDDNGAVQAWRVENSWGEDRGKDGYLIMSGPWFKLYGGEVDVKRDFVPAELLSLWDDPSKDVEVDPWSSMGKTLACPRH